MSDSAPSGESKPEPLTITPDDADASGDTVAGDAPATPSETPTRRGKSGSVIIVTPEEEAAAVAEAGAAAAAPAGATDSPKPRRSLFSIFSPKNKKKDKKDKKEKEKKEKKEKKPKKKSKKQIANEIQAQEEAMQAKVEEHQRRVIEARKRALQERLDRERDSGLRVKELEGEMTALQASHTAQRDEAEAAQRKLQASLAKTEARGVVLTEELAAAKAESASRQAELQAQARDLESRLQARDEEITRLEKSRQDLEQEKDRQHESLVSAMGSSDAATSALQKQFSELKEKLSTDSQTWDAERRAMQEKNQLLDAELRQVRAQAEELAAAVAAAEATLQERTSAAEADAASSSADNDALAASLRSAESQLAAAREQLAAQSARTEAADAKVGELAAERDELLEILDAREGTLKKLISSRRASAHQLRVVSGTVSRLSRVLKEDEGKRRRRRGARSKSAASRAEVASLRSAPPGAVGDFDAFEFLGNEFQELAPDEDDCVARAKAVDLYVHALTLLQRRSIKTPTFANADVKKAIRKVLSADGDDETASATMDEEEFLSVFQMGLLGVDPAAVDATLSDARSSDSVEAWLSSAFGVLDWELSGTIAPAIALRFVREVCAAAGITLADHAAQGFQSDAGLSFKAFSDAWTAIEAESSEGDLVKALRATTGVAGAAAAFARAAGSSKADTVSSDAVRSLVQRVVEDELDEQMDASALPQLNAADSIDFKAFLTLWSEFSLPLRFVLLGLEKSETRAKLEAAFGLVAGDASAVSAATPMVLAFYQSLCAKSGTEPDEALMVDIRKIGDQIGAQEFQDLIGRAAASGSKLTGSGSKLLGLCHDLETAVDLFKTKYENPFQIQVSDAPLEMADDVAKKAEDLAAEAVRKQEEAEAAKTRSRELPLREQTMAFLRWTNEHLAVRELEMDDLVEGFKDGTMLIQLLEILTGKKLPPHNAAAKCHLKIRRLENAQIALDFLQQVEGVRLVNISGSDIEAGHAKAILGLMWTLVLKFDAHETNAILAEAAAGAGEADKLRAWVDEQMQFAQLHPWETRTFMIKFTVPAAEQQPTGLDAASGAQ